MEPDISKFGSNALVTFGMGQETKVVELAQIEGQVKRVRDERSGERIYLLATAGML